MCEHVVVYFEVLNFAHPKLSAFFPLFTNHHLIAIHEEALGIRTLT